MSTNLKPWDFGDLCDALYRSAEFAYTFTRRNEGKDIPYDGPELTATSLTCSAFDTVTTLTDEMLEHDRSQGRDPLSVILSCAIRLGIENGWRMLTDDISQRHDADSIQRYFEAYTPPTSRGRHARIYAMGALERIRDAFEHPGHIGWPHDESPNKEQT